jgi:hypothetical protein
MSDSQAFRWERVSAETRFQRDPALAIPPDVDKLLTDGAVPPHRIFQTAGVYYYFGREPLDPKNKKAVPGARLRLWTKSDGLIVVEDPWAIGAEATFDLPRRRAVVASASDDARRESALFEVDLDARRKKLLTVEERADKWAFDSAFYLADGSIAARSRGRIYPMTRRGDHLTPGAFDLDTGDSAYIAVSGRLVVTPATIWEIDAAGAQKVAEFPGGLGLCVHAFDGRVLRYTREGCDRLIGPI